MDLASRPLAANALLCHHGQVLTSQDFTVIKWNTKGHTLSHPQGPLQIAEDVLSGCTVVLCLFSLKT